MRAVAEPRRETAQGFTKAAYITDEQFEAICEDIEEGIPESKACRNHGTSHTQVMRRVKKDADFAKQLQAARSEGREAYLANLIAHATALALGEPAEGNYKALKDLLIVYHPDFDKLRSSKYEVSSGGQPILLEAVRQLPLEPEELEMLVGVLEAVEQRKLAQLPSAVGE